MTIHTRQNVRSRPEAAAQAILGRMTATDQLRTRYVWLRSINKMVAIVHAKYPKPCPNCGSTQVLKPRLGYNVEGARAQCQRCDFLIFKSNRRLALEAFGTLMTFIPAVCLGLGMFIGHYKILILIMVLGLGVIFFSYRLPDSDKAVESRAHAIGIGSIVVEYGKLIVIGIALLVWAT